MRPGIFDVRQERNIVFPNPCFWKIGRKRSDEEAALKKITEDFIPEQVTPIIQHLSRILSGSSCLMKCMLHPRI
jgi:hypothetical protein